MTTKSDKWEGRILNDNKQRMQEQNQDRLKAGSLLNWIIMRGGTLTMMHYYPVIM